MLKKKHIIILFFLCYLSPTLLLGQINKGKVSFEIVRGKIGFYADTYRARKIGDAKFGDGIGFSSLIYLPFQWSVDYAKNFSDTTSYQGEFNQRLFIIKPTAIFSVNDRVSNTSGLGFQLSILITKNWYLEYIAGVVWVEASKKANDGLDSGFNVLQGFYISKPLSTHFTFSVGFNHLSNAHIFTSESSHDKLLLGLKYIF